MKYIVKNHSDRIFLARLCISGALIVWMLKYNCIYVYSKSHQSEYGIKYMYIRLSGWAKA